MFKKPDLNTHSSAERHQQQHPSQHVEKFIRDKARLHQILSKNQQGRALPPGNRPGCPAASSITLVTSPYNLEDLIQLAVDLKEDLGTLRDRPAPNRASSTIRPPPVRNSQACTPPPSEPVRTSVPNQGPSQLPQYRHCPRRHFH